MAAAPPPAPARRSSRSHTPSKMKTLIAVLMLAAGQAAFAGSLSRFTGGYTRQASIAGDCPPTIGVKEWTIDEPKIDVLTLAGPDGSTLATFSAPKKPSIGYPSDRQGNRFTTSFGPSPEYQGPACTVSAHFSASGGLDFSEACAGAAPRNCSYLRSF